MQFDHVQLEVVNETVDIEEVAHQGHQAVSYRKKKKPPFDFIASRRKSQPMKLSHRLSGDQREKCQSSRCQLLRACAVEEKQCVQRLKPGEGCGKRADLLLLMRPGPLALLTAACPR